MLMKFYAYSFEKVCEVVSIIFIILGMIFGFVLGYGFLPNLIDSLYYNDGLRIAIGVVCLFFGAAIALMFNIIVFGFIAQITEIRKQLEK